MNKNKGINRRDFLNGVALSLAAGTTLSPAEILARSLGQELPAYPPGLTGMRGSHDGSFEVDGKKLLCYGGSQSIDSPSSYSKVARQLLQDLSIDPDRFYDYFDRDYFKSRGLKGGIYFDRKTYGVDRVQVNPLPGFLGDNLSGAELEAAVRSVPISEEDQGELIRLIAGGVDYLDGMSREEKIELLRNTSYLAYLEKYAGMPKSVTGILQDTFLVMTAVGWEADSAKSAAKYYFPGTWELGGSGG
jgi:spermidine dehydrogenase